ncbi:MAG: hypothetical protein LBN27_01745 [Prevotellaceae bacterium]|jgi:hypothetical protein|nr:hypothetical protein [Prevotellaceae bacterium]
MAQEKVKIVVLQKFRNKFSKDKKQVFEPGAELSFPKERADDVIARGLAKLKE